LIDRSPSKTGVRGTGREGMSVLSVVNDDSSSLINEIVREGARRMLAAALEAEVNAYIAELADQRDERGRRLVVRNGYHQPRKVTTAAGAVEVKAPRVNDKRVDETTDEREGFSSAILPPGAASPRRSARCCRCSTCTACPPAASSRPGAVSGQLGRALPGDGHPAHDAVAGRSRRLHGP
jgi:hypothetical protein